MEAAGLPVCVCCAPRGAVQGRRRTSEAGPNLVKAYTAKASHAY